MDGKLKKIFLTPALISLLTAACSLFTTAPQDEKGPRILGIVTDEDSVALAGVSVTSLNGAYSCVTDSLGCFRLDSLENGTYDLQFSLKGYFQDTIKGIALSDEKPGAKFRVVLRYASIPRQVSGTFTYRFLMTGAVDAVLTGDNIDAAKPRRTRLAYDSASNSFSGIVRQPESGSTWNLRILVYDFDSVVVGETDIALTAGSGAIAVSPFFPINKILFLYNDSASAGDYFDFVSQADGRYTMISRRAVREIDSNGILLGTKPAGSFASVTGKGGIYASARLTNGDLLIGGTPDSTAGAGIFLARISPQQTVVWSKTYPIDSSIAWPLRFQERSSGRISIDIHVSGGGRSSGTMGISGDGTMQGSVSLAAGSVSSDKLHFFDERNSYSWEYSATITSGLSYSVNYPDGSSARLGTAWSGPAVITPFIDTWDDSCTVFLIRSQQSKKTWMISVEPVRNYHIHYYADGGAPVCRTSATSYLVAGLLDMSGQGLGLVLMLQDENLYGSKLQIKGLLSFPEVPLTMIKIRDKQYVGAGRTTAFSTDSHSQTFVLKMHESEIY